MDATDRNTPPSRAVTLFDESKKTKSIPDIAVFRFVASLVGVSLATNLDLRRQLRRRSPGVTTALVLGRILILIELVSVWS